MNGAIQEAEHVYIKAAFEECILSTINILEIGFGTGLNAYLTLKKANQISKIVNYTSLELYPLPSSITDILNYTEKENEKNKNYFEEIHNSNWEEKVKITENFFLLKIHTDFNLLAWKIDTPYNVIYFDAFAPDKQSEMWTQETFDFLYENTAPEGILTTYCAKGTVRRMLQKAGYLVERLPGPPGKREMLRAKKH